MAKRSSDSEKKVPLRDVPATIKRSSERVQEIYRETKASAREQYGRGRRENQTAFAQLKKMGYKKQGDKWVKGS